VAQQAGLDFVHVNGASGDKFLPEIIGGGALFLDFDNDGWLDVFLVDGGSFADLSVARRARHRLYRNRRNGTFADVTDASNIRPRGYGMGACAGDIDNDGLTDLYITNAALHNPNFLVDPNMTNFAQNWEVGMGDELGTVQGSYAVEQTANGPRLRITVTANPNNRQVKVEPHLSIPSSAIGKSMMARWRVDGLRAEPPSRRR